jgi:hypothetical protein
LTGNEVQQEGGVLQLLAIDRSYVVTDPEALSAIKLPEGEAVVEIPDYMIPLFNNPQ